MSEQDNEQAQPPYMRVSVDARGLRSLEPAERFAACQQIRAWTPAGQVDRIRAQAVRELVDERKRVHGANAAVGRMIGKSGTFVAQLVQEADRDRESFEQTSARLDAEQVEDCTAHPNARLRSVHHLADLVAAMLPGAVADAEADDFDGAQVAVSMIESAARDTLRILDGQQDPERAAEAEEIVQGRAPWQDHTWRARITYADPGNHQWREHSDGPFEVGNTVGGDEAAEEAGALASSFQARGGKSTPGRRWKAELWADPQAGGEADYVHEHTEPDLEANEQALAQAIATGQVTVDQVPGGNVDPQAVRAFVLDQHQRGGQE